MKRVLFLCSGNYYRSRFAEIFFDWHAKERCLDWKAESRGLTLLNSHPGFMSCFTIDRLNNLGIPVDAYLRLPTKATLQDFDSADRVVAVKEAEHRKLINARFPAHLERVEFWELHDLDFAGPDEAISRLEREVLGLIERLKDQTKQNDHFSTEKIR